MVSPNVCSAISPPSSTVYSLAIFPQIRTKKPCVTQKMSGWTARPARISMVQVHHTKLVPVDKLKNTVMRHGSFIQKTCYSRTTQEYENLEPIKSDGLSIQQKLIGIYKFCRPYALIGAVLSVLVNSLLPVETLSEVSLSYIIQVLKTVIAISLMQIYVIGLNELCDVKIDKSIAMAVSSGSPPLLYAVLSTFVTGIVYSVDLPFLRWKRNTFLTAALFIFNSILGIQTAIFLHFQNYVLGKPMMFTKSLYVASAFMGVFVASSCLLKDIPDMEGDRANGVMTLAVKIGKAKVFKLVVALLLMACGAAVLVGTTLTIPLNRVIVVLGHLLIATILLVHAQSVNLSDNDSVQSFYMFLWKLQAAVTLMFPFIC